MTPLRFTTAGILLAVLVVALALGAFVSDSELVSGAAFSVYLGMLALAITGALVGRANVRVFWVGFAVFAGLYGLSTFGSDGSAAATWNRQPTAISTAFLEWLASLRKPGPFVGAHVMAQWNNGAYYSARVVDYDEQSRLYTVRWDDGSSDSSVSTGQIQVTSLSAVRTGHAVLGTLVGLVGSVVSLVCFGERAVQPRLPKKLDTPGTQH